MRGIQERPCSEYRCSVDISIKLIKLNHTERMSRGASASVALGELRGTEIEWNVKIECLAKGMRGIPVVFSKKSRRFFGVASYGLDKTKYWILCEQHSGKKATIKGSLLSASDWPDTPLVVEVNSISVK